MATSKPKLFQPCLFIFLSFSSPSPHYLVDLDVTLAIDNSSAKEFRLQVSMEANLAEVPCNAMPVSIAPLAFFLGIFLMTFDSHFYECGLGTVGSFASKTILQEERSFGVFPEYVIHNL